LAVNNAPRFGDRLTIPADPIILQASCPLEAGDGKEYLKMLFV